MLPHTRTTTGEPHNYLAKSGAGNTWPGAWVGGLIFALVRHLAGRSKSPEVTGSFSLFWISTPDDGL
jgi:hypothetical protein